MKTDLLLTFNHKLDEYETVQDIVSAFAQIMDQYGFRFYGLLRQPKPHENPASLVLAGRWPEEWPEVYIRKKYVLIDPTVRYLNHAQRGFRWAETMEIYKSDPLRKRMERMMVDARSHGMEDGYIFPIHGRQGLLGNLSMGGKTVDLPTLDMLLFEALAKKMFWRMLTLQDPIASSLLQAAANIQLTRREMEALNFLADGMTSIEIGKVLQISNHTVDWYMNGIQEKLNAKNRQHAVAIAYRLGLIS
ncbi:LuxR family transcriptional regulator [Rhizobium sp. CFBP 8762]|uniref:LuxR family transcriptional regulator n=1 Tax=Rhizobium sp. CFBP 8762 TaxID=2775279 RepID=UPI00177C5CCA|nr:LuxR family transcriptional regulator [Rhizobium sp. CFBP 8762]MBD8556696.1 LuxR family transcriptional regulator [Rhizobium sp. CFBP 8762]